MNNSVFSRALRSPTSDSTEGGGSSQRPNGKKAAGSSRLGRGLGALIPPPAARPSGQLPPSVPVSPANPEPVKATGLAPGASSPAVSHASSARASDAEDASSGSVGQAARGRSGADPTPGGHAPETPHLASPTAPSRSASPSTPSRGAFDVSPTLGARASSPSVGTASTSEPKSPQVPRSTWNTGSEPAISTIPIARIQRNPRQPRERFDDAALRALAESIRQDGLLQPIVVRPAKGGSAGDGSPLFELVAGERRLRAFTLLGRSAIPAIVQTVDDRTSAVLALIENVQREDLNPMERAHGLQRLMHEFELSQQDLAARVGLDRSTVANLLRLNDLDPHTAAALREGSITTGHAKALLGLSDVGRRKVLLARVIADGLSVRELEREARMAAAAGAASLPRRLPGSGRVISAQVADLERRIGAHLGREVQIKSGRKPGSGAITIKFASHVQFEGLMERIGFDLEGSDRPPGR